ncbi:MAG: hypothetical protein DRJ65_21970 [Acidobacteria bacterium]|nr:MAG: hypothetical protein DRJ65_21970 [Acidobacteriota bacterium]
MNFRAFKPLAVAALAGCAFATFQPAQAALPPKAPASSDAANPFLDSVDGNVQLEGSSTIFERIKEYRRRHSVEGQLTSREMFKRSRWSYEHWLKDREQRLTKGIEGEGWVCLGPTNGAGRAVSIAPHPTDPNIVLVGSASGGVWKTVDQGASWYPTTDGLSDLAVGAVAYAPSDSNIVYLGTGEGDTFEIPGIGLLRSDDGGETWSLPATAAGIMAPFFYQLSVHPTDPDRVVAATSSGIITTDDGGVTWENRVPSGGLVVSATNVQRSASNPDLLYAAQWCFGSCPAGTDRVLKSIDGGLTWSPTANVGLDIPGSSGFFGRISLAIAGSDDQILYAGANVSGFVEHPALGTVPNSAIFRSDDGGENWSITAETGPYLGTQGYYDNAITVKPSDPNVVLAGGVSYVRSDDGGLTWELLDPYNMPGFPAMGTETIPHVDVHAYAWQGDRLWVGNDGGMWRSDDDGISWLVRNTGMVTRQNYSIAIDPINRERVLGGTQDNGTSRRNDEGDGTWTLELGGDGGECAINPLVNDIFYATTQFTSIYRKLPPAGIWGSITPFFGNESPPFVTPLVMHPSAPHVLFTAAETVFRSDNGGSNWRALGTEVPGWLWTSGTVTAIALTPADPDRIAIVKGSFVFTSEDAGQTWRLGMVGGLVLNVEISPHDPDMMLATGNLDGSGSIAMSLDAGQTWIQIGTGLPPFNVQVARWDPTDADFIYAGTDVGLYRSTDGGMTWARYGDGLPATSIHDLRILPNGSMLRVGTYGRGVWELAIEQSDNMPPRVEISLPVDDDIRPTIGDVINFEAQAIDENGDDITFEWLLTHDWSRHDGGSGNGTVSSSIETVITNAGSYLVAAVATDSHGAVANDYVHLGVLDPADSCDNPIVIPGDGPFPAEVKTSNAVGTIETSDPSIPCISGNWGPDAGRYGSTWFEITPVESGAYSVSTCGSSSDTVLSVWTGDRCGPYETFACNDDDENVHCSAQRTDSYVDVILEAGTTYRIMVGAWLVDPETGDFRGDFSLQVDCVTCTETPERLYIVPAAAHAAGQNNTNWLTDLDLYNPGNTDLDTEISFLPSGADNSSVEIHEVTINEGSAQSFPDVVATLLDASGSGAIAITTRGELLIASRTYNNAAEGTFGQFIPGASADNAVGAGQSVRLIGLAGNASFRTNIGIANASAKAATVVIDLLDGFGEIMATRDESLEAFGWLQINEIFVKENIDDVEAATALVRNTSSEAAIMAYASIVDEITGDPTYVSSADSASIDSPLWIAASAHADGVGASVWRTDLELANVSDDDLTATIELLPPGKDNTIRTQITRSLPGGESLRIVDLLDSGFETSGTAALKISVDGGELKATSRTYNLTEEGTYGQFIPGVADSKAIEAGDRAALIQLRQGDNTFRTNVGLVNLTDQQIEIRADFYNNAGGDLGFNLYTLEAFAYLQDNLAVPDQNGTAGGFAVLTSTTTGARFMAYASVIDSGSDDPVFIPATVISE